MSERVEVVGKLLDAVYLDHERCVAFLVEGPDRRMQPRIPREEIASFGDRTEEEIALEMDKYVEIVKDIYLNKPITVVFDPSLEGK